jgi:hypothetical protein
MEQPMPRRVRGRKDKAEAKDSDFLRSGLNNTQ